MEDYKKKYEEAVKKFKNFFDDGDDRILYKHNIETIFPELKESEDERIRKEMISFFEQEIPQCSIEEHKEYMRKWITWLERQSERKPTWSEEDEEMYNKICNDIDYLSRFTDRCDINTFNQKINWLKFLKERLKGE